MTVFPTRRPLWALGLWLLLAVATVFAPVLGPLLWWTGAAGVGLLIGDALRLWRSGAVRLERRLPERFVVGRRATLTLVLHHAA
ncbi:MAG: hypothetical protein MJE66_16835, partial [Proteobacteria bacterium]|nr:hypothetical protein [Pseudomonadota bacterium]